MTDVKSAGEAEPDAAIKVAPIYPLNSVARAAELLDRSPWTIWQMIRKGELEVVRDGRRSSVTGDSIAQRLRELRRAGPGEVSPNVRAALAARAGRRPA